MKNLTLSILTLALGCFLLQSCATDQNSSANSDSTNDTPAVATPANNATAPAANQAATPPAASKNATTANTAKQAIKTPVIAKKEEIARKIDTKKLLKANKQLSKATNKEELLKQTKKKMNPNLVKNIIDAYKKRGAALATSLCACSQKKDPAICKTKMTERVQKMRDLLKDDNLAAFNGTYEAGIKACK